MEKEKETVIENDEENVYDNIEYINISTEVKSSFLDYAMSVIVARALPDAKDGMKPVQRRILYGMHGLGNYANTAYKKSARIVGEVMGKYHPHGDSSIYEAMVRMAQPFSYRYPLVDGHGNFGSVDGDSAAAQRYTEARMSKLSMEMLKDIQKDTVDFADNYDGEEREPVVLPAKFPNLLVNGTTGIAVGMATNMPPHNLSETIDALNALIDDPDIPVIELMDNYIPGPDFPTGGIILGRSGIKKAYETGKGTIYIRSKADIKELENGKHEIIITELPYGVNKLNLYRKIIDLAKDKEIEGITNTVDESNMDGIKIIIECRKDVQPEVLLNQLYRKTQLQISYGINMLALVDNAPRVLSIKELFQVYLDHQIDVVTRKTRFDLNKALDRAHILEGLRIAIDHIDEIVDIIKTSSNDDVALNRLMERFGLSEIQGKSILDMQMRRLTGLQRQRIEDEYNELLVQIADLRDILNRQERVLEIIKNELNEVKAKFGDERKTEINESEGDIDDESLIPVEEVVISITHNDYIKRTTVDTYKTQNRGGKGIKGMGLNSDDIVDEMIIMSTHDDLLLFTNFGKVYRIKGYNVPSAGRTAKGMPVVNLLNLSENEKVRALVGITPDEDLEHKYLCFVTRNGLIKRVALPEFISIRQTGKIAVTLREDDELFGVQVTSGEDEIIIAGDNGKAIRFNENDVRPMARNASGVKGFDTDGGKVVGIATSASGQYILSITENGYGKKTLIDEYRKTNRGGKGVATINITEKNGKLMCLKAVNGDEDALLMSDDGTIIRISLDTVAIYGRNTQGVKLINVDNSKLAAVTVVEHEEEETNGIEKPEKTENRELKTELLEEEN
ncbi:MAG TPA: DNA gyrase subunit A [Erysipelotrichaceae bacterium]|nr:DNA gyrase subunit A [Erysipelotrichaceae bacterium]